VFAAVAALVFGGLLQAVPSGTIIGEVKAPEKGSLSQPVRIVLLPPKYTELWNRQVQTRIDNYWEIFKPEFIANKERFVEFNRMAQVEAFRYVTSNMRRDLGDAASKLMKDAPANGQFDFSGIPFGTYQLLVLATFNGRDLIWLKTVEVQTEIPIFVDLGKPVS